MKDQFISLSDAAERLGVSRGTLHYYLERIKDPKIERVTFQLDKKKYIRLSDVERIRRLREEAAERGELTRKMPVVK